MAAAAVIPHTLTSRIRGTLALIYLVFGGVTASLLVVPLVVFGGRRNRAQHIVERAWAGGVLWIAGIRVEVRGREHLPASGAVIVANHRSNADVFSIMGAAATPARFIAKAELRWVFFISLGMWMTGHIFVKRGQRKSGGRALNAAAEDLGQGAWVLLFPEGTRPNRQEPALEKRRLSTRHPCASAGRTDGDPSCPSPVAEQSAAAGTGHHDRRVLTQCLDARDGAQGSYLTEKPCP